MEIVDTSRPMSMIRPAPGPGARELIDETPVAFVCEGVTLAVMMATPANIDDFAVGLSWTEGLSSRVLSDYQIDVNARHNGIECHLTLSKDEAKALQRRLRAVTSPSACGLCGVRSIAQAVPPPPTVEDRDLRLTPELIDDSVLQLRRKQPLHDRTRAAHAAGFLLPQRGIVCVREDIGRHNALDKLIGAVLRRKQEPHSGVVVLTSRVSVEMVQKTAALGAQALIAVSAPSALSVRVARAAGITLITNVRHGRWVVHTHDYRVVEPTSQAVDDDLARARELRSRR